MELLANIVLFIVTILMMGWVSIGVFFATLDTLSEAFVKSVFLRVLIWLILILTWFVVLGLFLQ